MQQSWVQLSLVMSRWWGQEGHLTKIARSCKHSVEKFLNGMICCQWDIPQLRNISYNFLSYHPNSLNCSYPAVVKIPVSTSWSGLQPKSKLLVTHPIFPKNFVTIRAQLFELSCCQTDRQTDRHRQTHTDRQTDTHTDTHTHRQTDRQTYKKLS